MIYRKLKLTLLNTKLEKFIEEQYKSKVEKLTIHTPKKENQSDGRKHIQSILIQENIPGIKMGKI